LRFQGHGVMSLDTSIFSNGKFVVFVL
jgi:hypothetical protein